MARLILALLLLAALALAVAAAVTLARSLRGPIPAAPEVTMPGSVRAISYALLLLLLLGVTSGWLGPA